MLETLIRASIDGALLVALVWLLCRALPGLSAATRTLLWWCAGAKFVLALAWPAPILLPVLPAAGGPPAVVHGSAISRAAAGSPVPAATPLFPIDLVSAVVVIWIVGVSAAAAAGLRRWRQTREVIDSAAPAPSDLADMAAALAGRLALRRVPDVRVSAEVATPLVAGLRQPVILLPANRFAELTSRQQQLALCHELAHLRRADLWLGLVPALAERAFFFHPLARVAAREYAFWREAACDAAVIDALDAAPQEYGRLLLDLGVSRPGASLAAAGASWSFSSLKRRIVMLRDTTNRTWASRAVSAAALGVAVCALPPLELTARQSLPAASPALAPDRTLAAPAGWGALAADDEGQDDQSRLKYVLLKDDDHIMMSGSNRDVDRARSLRRAGEPLLWARVSGREYVIRDAALLQQLEDIWKPVHVIGEEQGRVGGQQGEIGAKQGEIGKKQGRVGEEQGRVGEKQGRIGEKMAALGEREGELPAKADRKPIDDERRGLDAQMRELDAEMKQLDAKMRELDRPMRELDDQMRVLDGQMRELDVKMREASRRAEEQMRALIDRAIASGAAEPVK